MDLLLWGILFMCFFVFLEFVFKPYAEEQGNSVSLQVISDRNSWFNFIHRSTEILGLRCMINLVEELIVVF